MSVFQIQLDDMRVFKEYISKSSQSLSIYYTIKKYRTYGMTNNYYINLYMYISK